jgi:hypothetical protein
MHPVTLTYDSDAHQDGPCAQYQRILGLAAVAQKMNMGYRYTPPKRLSAEPTHMHVEQVDRLQKWEIFFGFRALERNGQEPVCEMTVRNLTPDVLLIDEPTLVHAAYPFPFIDCVPDWYDAVTGDYCSIADRSPQVWVVLHVRRGGTRPDSSLFVDMAYYRNCILAIRKLLVEKGMYPFFRVVGQRSIFGADDHYEELAGEDVTLDIDGDERAAFFRMATADVLVMAKSSFSYMAGLLNRKTVIYNPWMQPSLGRWTNIWEYTGDKNCT